MRRKERLLISQVMFRGAQQICNIQRVMQMTWQEPHGSISRFGSEPIPSLEVRPLIATKIFLLVPQKTSLPSQSKSQLSALSVNIPNLDSM
jgi:hypothetical protein